MTYLVASLVCAYLLIQSYEVVWATPVQRISNGIIPPATGLIASSALACFSSFLMALLALRLVERRSFAVLGFALHRKVWIEVGQGVGLGLALAALILLGGWAGGFYSVSWSGLPPFELIGTFPAYAAILLLSAVFEETLARGYAFQVLVQSLGKSAAVILSSFLFALAHIFNPHIGNYAIMNTTLAGLLLAVAYLRTRSLWLPSSLHLTWNLTLGFVVGCPVSGVSLQHTVLRVMPLGQEWITGGSYGPEAGVISTPVLAVATILLLRTRFLKPHPSTETLW